MNTTLEERVARIEEELSRLRSRVLASPSATASPADWRNLLGTFDDDPAFEEILREGRKFRDAQIADYDAAQRS